MAIASLTIFNNITFGDLMVGALAVIGIMAIAVWLAIRAIEYARKSIVVKETRELNEKELRRLAREEMKTTFAVKEKVLKEQQAKIKEAAQTLNAVVTEPSIGSEDENALFE